MTEQEKIIRHKKQKKDWREKNPSRVLELKRRWYKENAEKILKEARQYRKDNSEEIKKKFKERNATPERKKKQKQYMKNRTQEALSKSKEKRIIWEKNKMETDDLYKSKRITRNLIRTAFKGTGKKKNTKSAEILGCTFQEFKLHLESKFESWMTWKNHGVYTGNYNETWNVDHIIPMASAKTDEDVARLNHYTNLRPLCSKKNSEKHSKLLF